MSSLKSSLRTSLDGPTPQTDTLDFHINLTDNTIPPDQDAEQPSPDDASATNQSLSRANTAATSQRLGPSRLREQLARRKYAKYQEHRYRDSEDDDEGTEAPASKTTTIAITPGTDQASTTNGVAGAARPGMVARDSTFKRGRDKVKTLLGRKKRRNVREGDAQIDSLFENQRGIFLFGIPFYSSNSLLNFDPPAWTTAEGKPSPVDITNAQVPDPNWEWAWRTWYVDMSIDVDEEGWQYSFMFPSRFPWHGTHPWFHSFVRRRRWIRKRVRKHRHLPDGRVEGGQTMQDAHKLNADYFTIHPTRDRSPDSSYPASSAAPTSIRQSDKLDGAEEEEQDDIEDIRTLLKRLKGYVVDRDKIRAVLKFMDQGGQDIYYLAEEMPHIMSLFMFEYSRRKLATAMLYKLEGSVSDQQQDTPPSEETEEEKTKRENLVRAVKAADEEIKKLEFWSDIRQIVEQGDTLTGASEAEGWDETWTGMGSSGPAGSVREQDPAPSAKKVDKGKGRA